MELGKASLNRVDVICPGFAADCLETLEEINQQNRELFLTAGGKEFHYISALNNNPEHIQALLELVIQHTHGWTECSQTQVELQAEAQQRMQGYEKLEKLGIGN